MLSSLPAPIIFAHRGASALAPENTLAAFLLAAEKGAPAIELDVQLTRDQTVIVFHDTRLDRTTNGSGLIKSLTYTEIKNLNASFLFPDFPNEPIPTLDQVLEVIPEHILINIELKNLHAPFDNLPSKTASLIRKFGAQKRVLISSFNPIALRSFNRSIPSVPLGRLIASSPKANVHSRIPPITEPYRSIHLNYKYLTPGMVARFRSAGKLVFCYTINQADDMIAAVAMGIDGFFTDDPIIANRILTQQGLIEQHQG